jgi:hypothetical protein
LVKVRDTGIQRQGWWSSVEADSAVAYLLARQKPGGGFGLTPRLPATVEDTYYCLRALELLGATGEVRSLADYLSALPVSATSPAKVLFQQAYLRRGVVSTDGLEEALTVRLGRQPTLAELYYTLRAARELGGPSQERLAGAVGTLVPERVSRWRTVRDLWQVLVLSGSLRLPPPAGCREWLRSSQNLDGGLGFLPGTTSFLENTFYGLRAARVLKVELRWPERCGRFVLRARSGAGGYGRTNSAVPSPETTFMALASLRLLDALQGIGPAFDSVAAIAPVGEETWRPTAN